LRALSDVDIRKGDNPTELLNPRRAECCSEGSSRLKVFQAPHSRGPALCLLIEESKRADYRLADYFDYVADTSTGGIIAVGMSVKKAYRTSSSFALAEWLCRTADRIDPA
jgi:hypothetical protein